MENFRFLQDDSRLGRPADNGRSKVTQDSSVTRGSGSGFGSFVMMGNSAASAELPQMDMKDGKISGPGSTLTRKPTAGPKIPMPPEEELEERFCAVLVSPDVQNLVWQQKEKECGNKTSASV